MPETTSITKSVTPSEIAGNGQTILLVEDEAFVREITAQVLKSAGYVVLEASNAEEALWAVSEYQGSVHLLLTDMIMPGRNGAELAAELGALSPEMKTILTSGYGENVAEELCRNPHTFFLPKPFSVQSLTRKIRNVLDDKQP